MLAQREQIARLIKAHLGVGSETIDDLMAQQDEEDIELLDEIEVDSEAVRRGPGSVGRPAGQRDPHRGDRVAGERRPHRVAGRGHQVRYRIDGMLQPQPVPPEINRFQAAIISRLKIMARLNIAEKRLPQDGRIKLRVSGREIDVRVSIIPMIHGEGIVMRLLDKGRDEVRARRLGMEPDLRTPVQRADSTCRTASSWSPGPTGSGKTTTLYSALLEIKDETTKIITIEDPVEYQLEGINQIQVHPKIGLTFAASLRAILRHDPDVVLVGEIRDMETAENAIQASLTGHLVFSTLHTNDAPSAFTRLIDMGVEPFLVASTVEGVMAQRLVRTLCTKCREPFEPKRDDLPKDFPWEEYQKRGKPLYRPQGCRAAASLASSGRQGIFELCVTTDAVRQLAHDRASSWEIRKAARADGMRTLREDAWLKVLGGVTTIDEVLRVTKGDRI